MEYIIIIITCCLAILALIDKKWDTMKLKIINSSIAILAVLLGVLSGVIIANKNHETTERIRIDNVRCHNALSAACNNIYRTVNDYNRHKKTISNDSAMWVASEDFNKSNLMDFDHVREDFKDYITPTKLAAIDDIRHMLYEYPKYIINNNRINILYSDICKIDTSYLHKPKLYELTND